MIYVTVNHLYCCTPLYYVLCVTGNHLYCCTSLYDLSCFCWLHYLLQVISFTTLFLLGMWCMPNSLLMWSCNFKLILIYVMSNHLYCCMSLYDVSCVTVNHFYCRTSLYDVSCFCWQHSLLPVTSITTLFFLWTRCTPLHSWCVARTPLILVLSMAKTSSFHPGSPNPSNKQIMTSQKKGWQNT